MLDTVVISGDDVCCSVVFVFSVMWSELLMTSDISCHLWSSVYKCQRVECDMFVLYCMSVSAVSPCIIYVIRNVSFSCSHDVPSKALRIVLNDR